MSCSPSVFLEKREPFRPARVVNDVPCKGNNPKGAIENTAGKVTGDAKLQAEGKLEKAKGAARSAVGDVKEAVKSAKMAQSDEGRSADGE